MNVYQYMKPTTLLIIIVMASFGCKKNNKSLPDDIEHTELQPPLQITCVDSVVNHPSNCGMVPYPYDSTAQISLDINNDGVDDFIVKCESWYNTVSVSNPCSNHNSTIQIYSTNPDNKVFKQDAVYPIIKKLVSNEGIGSTSLWYEGGFILSEGADMNGLQTDYNGDAFIGLRMKLGNEEHFGWMHINKTDYLVIIDSYGFNHTPNNSILAGQIN